MDYEKAIKELENAKSAKFTIRFVSYDFGRTWKQEGEAKLTTRR